MQSGLFSLIHITAIKSQVQYFYDESNITTVEQKTKSPVFADYVTETMLKLHTV